MQGITATVGLDIAKSVFQVHGVDAARNVVVRRQPLEAAERAELGQVEILLTEINTNTLPPSRLAGDL